MVLSEFGSFFYTPDIFLNQRFNLNFTLKTDCYIFFKGLFLFDMAKKPIRAYIHFCIRIIAYPGLMSILIMGIVHFFLIYAASHWRSQIGGIWGGIAAGGAIIEIIMEPIAGLAEIQALTCDTMDSATFSADRPNSSWTSMSSSN